MTLLEKLIDKFVRSIRDDPKRNETKISVGDDPENPTYWRWYVWPRREPGEWPKTFWKRVVWYARYPTLFNLYLHNFLQDDAHDLHDHRMVNISIILQGAYWEERFVEMPYPGAPLPMTVRSLIPRLTPFFRLPSTPHRVVLPRDSGLRPVSSWSLFIGFPHWRNWGFWCGGRDGRSAFWRPHEQYAMARDPLNKDYGRKGAGCG